MLLSFAFAVATMLAVLASQTLLKLVNGPPHFAIARRTAGPGPAAVKEINR